jgi:hypothetical protein
MFLYEQGSRPRHSDPVNQSIVSLLSFACCVAIMAVQAFMRPRIQEKTYFVISNPFKDMWQPEWKRVGGDAFIKLDKYDRDFFKHCTGSAIAWGTKAAAQNHYFPFWEDLVKLRNDASQAAFERVIDGMREDESVQKKQKPRRAIMSDAALAGEVVQGTMRFGNHTQDAKMLFGCRGTHVWVQADEDVVAFIQHAIHSNFVSEHARPEPKPPRKKHKSEDDNNDNKDENGNTTEASDGHKDGADKTDPTGKTDKTDTTDKTDNMNNDETTAGPHGGSSDDHLTKK